MEASDTIEGVMELSTINRENNKFLLEVNSSILNGEDPFFLLKFLTRRNVEGQTEERSDFAAYMEEKYGKSKGFLSQGFGNTISVFSTSPVRSRPKRTYDPTREFDDPEGSDVPMLLMRIEATNRKSWDTLKRQLDDFGKSSGLYQSIEVRNLGQSLGAPFQLRVKVRGPNSNIMDVWLWNQSGLAYFGTSIEFSQFPSTHQRRVGNGLTSPATA